MPLLHRSLPRLAVLQEYRRLWLYNKVLPSHSPNLNTKAPRCYYTDWRRLQSPWRANRYARPHGVERKQFWNPEPYSLAGWAFRYRRKHGLFSGTTFRDDTTEETTRTHKIVSYLAKGRYVFDEPLTASADPFNDAADQTRWLHRNKRKELIRPFLESMQEAGLQLTLPVLELALQRFGTFEPVLDDRPAMASSDAAGRLETDHQWLVAETEKLRQEEEAEFGFGMSMTSDSSNLAIFQRPRFTPAVQHTAGHGLHGRKDKLSFFCRRKYQKWYPPRFYVMRYRWVNGRGIDQNWQLDYPDMRAER